MQIIWKHPATEVTEEYLGLPQCNDEAVVLDVIVWLDTATYAHWRHGVWWTFGMLPDGRIVHVAEDGLLPPGDELSEAQRWEACGAPPGWTHGRSGDDGATASMQDGKEKLALPGAGEGRAHADSTEPRAQRPVPDQGVPLPALSPLAPGDGGRSGEGVSVIPCAPFGTPRDKLRLFSVRSLEGEGEAFVVSAWQPGPKRRKAKAS